MSLAEAAAKLKVAPNTIRSRFKAGKIKGERDNSGKIWVWIDLDAHKEPPPLSKPSKEGSKSFEVEAFKAHIQMLTEQLSEAKAELEALRSDAVKAAALEATVSALEAQVLSMKDDRDQWRQIAQTMIGRPASGFMSLFRRR